MLEVDGLNEIIKDLNKIDAENIKPYIHSVGEDILTKSLYSVPVDTGDLKSSLTLENGYNDTTIYTGVYSELEYADEVEFGAVDRKPELFLTKSYTEHEENIEQNIINELFKDF